MTAWTEHLAIAPVILPLFTGAAMLMLNERRHSLKATINLVSTLLLTLIALILLREADAAPAGTAAASVYLLADWPAPFGIVLVVDRLAAMMLVLSAVLGLAALIFSLARWHRAGSYFHPMFQFLLMGLNGAFLTGDLFNLFVFFEVLLAASYGLALHGVGSLRVKAGLHYIAINLAASLLFLIGVALIYGVTGTLNMADLVTRVPQLAAGDRVLLETGAAVLGIAFLTKAGMWPLCFWLPTTYAAAAAPVAALFAIMSKVGIYAVLRLWLLLFGADAGGSAFFGESWLLVGGLLTLSFGAIGMLASQDMARMAGYSVLVSSGTLLAAIGSGVPAATAPALFYMASSTLAIAAFFLLIELVERSRRAGADILAVTLEAFGGAEVEPEDDEAGVVIPATMALLGLSFLLCALLLAGLPPVSGFLAKFALVTALFNPTGLGGDGTISAVAWVLLAALLLSGLAAVIAMARAGVRAFWVPVGTTVPRVRVIEMLPVAGLLALCLTMTVAAGPVMSYMQDTAARLHAPAGYVDDVLSTPRTGGRLQEVGQ